MKHRFLFQKLFNISQNVSMHQISFFWQLYFVFTLVPPHIFSYTTPEVRVGIPGLKMLTISIPVT